MNKQDLFNEIQKAYTEENYGLISSYFLKQQEIKKKEEEVNQAYEIAAELFMENSNDKNSYDEAMNKYKNLKYELKKEKNKLEEIKSLLLNNIQYMKEKVN